MRKKDCTPVDHNQLDDFLPIVDLCLLSHSCHLCPTHINTCHIWFVVVDCTLHIFQVLVQLRLDPYIRNLTHTAISDSTHVGSAVFSVLLTIAQENFTNQTATATFVLGWCFHGVERPQTEQQTDCALPNSNSDTNCQLNKYVSMSVIGFDESNHILPGFFVSLDCEMEQSWTYI